jgi:hypothetical protein
MNYTIAEFLGIFFVGLPVFVFASTILLWGIGQMIEHLFEDETIKNFFHHHYHYKAKP